MECAILDKGFRTCLLFRICPLVPFNIFNFLAGATSLKFKDYFWAFIGYLPACIVNVCIGTTIKSLSDITRGEYEGGTTSIVVLVIGLFLTIVILVYITIMIRRYLRKFV